MQLIREIARFAIGLFRRFKQFIRWRIQYRQVLKRAEKHEFPTTESLGLKRVLILTPHADDELIGCSTFLLNKSLKASVLYFRLYGHNTSVANKIIRDNEISRLSNKLGFILYENEEDVKEWLMKRLINHEYDAILVPCPFDWHWEHRLVFSLFVEALNSFTSEEIPEVLFYIISVPLPPQKNTFVSVIGEKGQKDKWSLFQKYYISQKMPILRYQLQEKLNNNGAASELFWRTSKSEMSNIYCRYRDKHFISELDSLQGEINDIRLIRSHMALLMSNS